MPGPGHAFIAIRFHWHAAILQTSSPASVQVHSVDQIVRAGEFANRGMVCVSDQACKVVFRWCARESCDLNPARCVASKSWMPDFNALALGCVYIRVLCAAVIDGVKRSVGQHVEACPHADPMPRRSCDLQAHDSVKRLPKVDHPDAWLGLHNLYGVEYFGHPNWLDHLSFKLPARRFDDLCGLPVGIVKVGGGPAGHFHSCVVFFTIKFVAGAQRTVVRQLPVFTRDDRLF